MTNLTALVADDSLSARKQLCKALQKAGITVTETKDGEKAWQLATRHRYDLILTDVYLPKIDGIELTGKLRQHPDYAATPILMVANTKVENKKDAIRDAGASGLIRLPITPADFTAIVSKLLPR